MEEIGMSHRDLKPENILLNHEANLKVADLGFASLRPINTSFKGTWGYMAPEIVEDASSGYSGNKADIFAAATILFIMVCRHPPFAEAIRTDPHYKLIHANRYDLFWRFHAWNKEGGLAFFGEELMDLISQMI